MLFTNSQLKNMLTEAFPAALRSDVCAVVRRLLPNGGRRTYLPQFSEWRIDRSQGVDDGTRSARALGTDRALNSDGRTETVRVPDRVYLRDVPTLTVGLTPVQKLIYSCILSRSYNGYVRQRHLRLILRGEVPQWVLPYVIKLCDEYVPEITADAYDRLKSLDGSRLRLFCMMNIDNVSRGFDRMRSYHYEYYGLCPARKCIYNAANVRDYVGYKLYSECLGYRRSGQKYIEFPLTPRAEELP